MIRTLASASLIALTFMASISARVNAQAPAPVPVAVEATPENAAAFVGDWVLNGTGQNGPTTFALNIGAVGGKLLGEISGEAVPRQIVNGLSKVGDALTLRYDFDYQGMAIPVVLTLTPADGKVSMAMDFAQGAYQMTGTATKKEPAK